MQKLHTFFSKKFQHIRVSLDLNFNESLTNDIVSFEQLGPECFRPSVYAFGRLYVKTLDLVLVLICIFFFFFFFFFCLFV